VGGEELTALCGEFGPWTPLGLMSSCLSDLETLNVTLLWLRAGEPSRADAGPFCFRRRGWYL